MKKFRDNVNAKTVIPEHWGSNQRGMQAIAELDNEKVEFKFPVIDIDGSQYTGNFTARGAAEHLWQEAKAHALSVHELLEKIGLHKQIANRIIEPWFHIQVLCTATEWVNFFALRCHNDAHPDIAALADAMLFQYLHNQPQRRRAGEWHLPFYDYVVKDMPIKQAVQVCTARAARLSYLNFDGKIDVNSDLEIYERLKKSGHWSPFEHPAYALKHSQWVGNFRGWFSHRKEFSPEENRYVNLAELLAERQAAGSEYALGKKGFAEAQPQNKV